MNLFNIIHTIIDNLPRIVEHGGYAFLFLSTVIEGVPIIGQFIPGHTIVLISGFLAKLDILNIYVVSVIVVFSAMVGDFIGFSLGRKYGFESLTRFGSYFSIKKEYLDKVLNLVRTNTIKTIILGRFSPVTRTLSPFIVGASGIDVKRFWLYDFISVLIWSTVSLAIGYIFGASYHQVSVVFGKYILISILVGVFMIWFYRFINKQFHIFAKYELITLCLNLFGLYLFFKTIQDALTDKVFLLELDLYVNNFFQMNATDFWLDFMNIVTNIFSPLPLTAICLVWLLYFIHQKKYHYVIITSLSLGGGYILTFLIKNIVLRIRPENAAIIETGYSFPSGHAVTATIFFAIVIYFFVLRVRSIVLRELLVVACVFIALLVSFSRVYLGVHWLSDVFAGIGLGLFWVTLIILFVKYAEMVFNTLKKVRRKNTI